MAKAKIPRRQVIAHIVLDCDMRASLPKIKQAVRKCLEIGINDAIESTDLDCEMVVEEVALVAADLRVKKLEVAYLIS